MEPTETTAFEHCANDEAECWKTFYLLACLVHPDQGGVPGEFEALCAQARQVLDWPPLHTPKTIPLFDIFCKATGTANPFGESICNTCDEKHETEAQPAVPAAYDPESTTLASHVPPSLGKIELVYTSTKM